VSILLDTHAALWYALGDATLSPLARSAIENENGMRYISPASYWEIAIKIQMGKYLLSVPFRDFWSDAIERCGYTVLPIAIIHAEKLAALPLIHRDPFDRMLVCQALTENVALVSSDAQLDGYGIRRIW